MGYVNGIFRPERQRRRLSRTPPDGFAFHPARPGSVLQEDLADLFKAVPSIRDLQGPRAVKFCFEHHIALIM
jgi:hypothetical protein